MKKLWRAPQINEISIKMTEKKGGVDPKPGPGNDGVGLGQGQAGGRLES